jgi:bifunctional polynucleotide phosphatase/kinase
VILSNQGGISLKTDSKSLKIEQKRLADFKAKLSAVLTQLDIPLSVYAATALDQYRKPRIGMWQAVLRDYGLEGDVGVDLEQSFFVGDAGGREGSADGGIGKDHACSDRYIHNATFLQHRRNH